MEIVINVLAVVGLLAIIGACWIVFDITRKPNTHETQEKPWGGPEYEYRPKK